MADRISLSIRALTEFLLRQGSIDSRFSGLDRAAEGARIHRRLQKQGGKNYKAELALQIEIEQDGFLYRLAGRADGVVDTPGGLLVDEIKTIASPLESLAENDHPAHWAQGCIYAHILCSQRQLSGCAVQLRYYQVETGEIQAFIRHYTEAELKDSVHALLTQYSRWARLSLNWKAKRDASLRALQFPFAQYRSGQRQMAIACYNTYKMGGRLFCCAPTGTGKTLSALFPALKALGEGYGERIFYLTAKTIARKAAEDALALLAKNQACNLRQLTLTAKDKICFLEERRCLPEYCPYAEGYYDRVNDAVYTLLQEGTSFSRQNLEAAAKKYRLCPYELSLDLSLWCDCVVCDYNYLFDPVVHLQRFFESPGESLFLVDEAHNLVDRSREMYSARLQKGSFFAFKKQLPKQYSGLHKALNGINRCFISLRHQGEEAGVPVFQLACPPAELDQSLQKFRLSAEAFLQEHRGHGAEESLLELYFSVLFYQKIREGFDASYTVLLYSDAREVSLKLFCLDPSTFLEESLSLGRASVLFSATLLPLPYYRETLGGGEDAKLQNLPSPFQQGYLGLFVAGEISTKYARRRATLPEVADMLATLASGKTGNYLAYFPSYQYLREAAACLSERHPHLPLLIQESGMDEAAREHFLAAFQTGASNTLLGLCVLGGIFAEGVDLPGERLIGTAVVGVGLPQIGPEPDAIRDYYAQKNGFGFEYAYQFPGMNKVLQAAGRVIRTENDCGVVLLIDSRFTSQRYLSLFPAHWSHWQAVTAASLPAALAGFWAKNTYEANGKEDG